MPVTADIDPRPSVPVNKKRKVDDADIDPYPDSSRPKGPIRVVGIAPGGEFLIKVSRNGRNDHSGSKEDDDIEVDASGVEIDEVPEGGEESGGAEKTEHNDNDELDIIVSSEDLSSGQGMSIAMLPGTYIESHEVRFRANMGRDILLFQV